MQYKRKRRFAFPTSVSKQTFYAHVQTGDVLLTRTSNILSYLQARTMLSAVSHVSLAVVDDMTKKVYMFESGAPRGSQLRDLDDYMKDGADYMWWRTLDPKFKEKVTSGIEKYAKSAYSWGFLRHLPREILGIDAPGQERDESTSFSCGELVGHILEEAGAVQPRNAWLPIDFLGEFTHLSDAKNVVF